MSVTSSVYHILDIPDEILIEILLYATARERAVLGNSSKRFNRLVFNDKKLLRDLDFSNKGRLTSALDIQQYFRIEDVNKHILKVNLRNVNCMEPGQMLNDYVGKALNLVDINIHGIELKDIPQLGSFLKPLEHVKRLSMDWPITTVNFSADYREIRQIVQKQFSRLTYLSVRTHLYPCLWEFAYMVDLCQELKELQIVHSTEEGDGNDLSGVTGELANLEVFEFCGDYASFFKGDLLELLPKPEDWLGFGLFAPLDEKCFHLENKVEVCKELLETNCIEDLPDSWDWTLGNCLNFESLLREVIKITQENISEKFCSSQFPDKDRCALKIEDAKLLLKNPRHQIKYLYLSESIGTKCDVHLLALAASSLTELYLCDIMKFQPSTSKQTDFDEQNHLMNSSQLDSSFKMLVENTPLVRDLTLNGRPGELEVDEVWDLGPLCLIQGWENLKSLRLLSIPICDGKFLIEIGKQCKSLMKLEFCNLGPSHGCCYAKELSLILSHCQNLTDFSMHACNIGQVSDVFVSLAKNLQLRRVCLTSFGERNDTLNLLSSVELLLRSCFKLITFVCIIEGISQTDSDQLTSVLRRLRTELHRPALQFQVIRKSNSEAMSTIDTVCEDSSPPSFPCIFDEFNYS